MTIEKYALFYLLFLSSLAFQAVAFQPRCLSSTLARCSTTKLFFSDDEDEDDEIEPAAYGNRSLAWTQRFRKLIPYEHARHRAMDLGISSKDEWEELLSDGRGTNGPYLVSRPDEMYKEEWVSWEEFLGAMRSYEETRQIVRNILQLSTMEEYQNFVTNDPKRAEGLRIPFKPDIVYKDKGWQGPDDFFGKID